MKFQGNTYHPTRSPPALTPDFSAAITPTNARRPLFNGVVARRSRPPRHTLTPGASVRATRSRHTLTRSPHTLTRSPHTLTPHVHAHTLTPHAHATFTPGVSAAPRRLHARLSAVSETRWRMSPQCHRDLKQLELARCSRRARAQRGFAMYSITQNERVAAEGRSARMAAAFRAPALKAAAQSRDP